MTSLIKEIFFRTLPHNFLYIFFSLSKKWQFGSIFHTILRCKKRYRVSPWLKKKHIWMMAKGVCQKKLTWKSCATKTVLFCIFINICLFKLIVNHLTKWRINVFQNQIIMQTFFIAVSNPIPHQGFYIYPTKSTIFDNFRSARLIKLYFSITYTMGFF
jgi:hypothetical protein